MSIASDQPPRPAQPRVVKDPDVRREEIVRAAGELFAEQGVRATTFGAVAAKVGVVRSLVHHYFADKSVLVDHVLRARIDVFVEDLRAWDAAREVGDIDHAVTDCIALLRRHVPGRGSREQRRPEIDDAGMYLRFVDAVVDTLVETILATTVADYAARHRIEIDHVRETFIVLVHGLIGLIRSHPEVPDTVLGDLVRQTLRLAPNDPPPLPGAHLEGE